ncbi:HD domain-containing protein [Lactobacillus crispatus]|uniref:HD domain-containing protein n=1 Tax=Lactobacillus crispatus TaxID=47770 RepID=A0AAW6XIA7_9LACO|nr:phosphohydrolase [Lactobacillus crispatus]MDK6503101.1 HD domain-containing protein [Lactobacillus crispatus]PLA29515.1 phosphohydrolase [Lactobacillus crispatus]
MSMNDIKLFSKKNMAYDPTGHDYLHAQRVAEVAIKIYRADYDSKITAEGLYIVEAASYLHDTIDEKITMDMNTRLKEVQALLEKENISTKASHDIWNIIQHMSYSKNIEHHYQLSDEGKCVQDADRIDALGAIGIARAFAYGGHAGQEIYNPRILVMNFKNHDDYRKHKGTTINHFYEKLLKLAGLMNTRTGKEEAQRRTQYMYDFLTEFKVETGVENEA